MTAASLFDRITALADGTRSRMLLVLEAHELAVSELQAVFQLPQSTVSRHLKTLAEEGWVGSRVEGTSRHYRMADRLDASAQELWRVVRREVAAGRDAAQDAARLHSVLAQRHTTSREFFRTAAGQWDQLRAELFGDRAELGALAGLLDEHWTVADLGCGTGRLAEALAPFVGRVIALDESAEMLAAARSRLSHHANVDIKAGSLEALPLPDASLDAALVTLVLHHIADPAPVLAEARRVLKPGGRLLIVDMTPHDRTEYRQRMGHAWLGFGAEQLAGWLTAAGFAGARYLPLPADPAAQGPALFACTARVPVDAVC